MHKRQSQHGGTACDEEAIINLGWFVQVWEGGGASTQSASPAQMGDSIKRGNKYQSGRKIGAHRKNNRRV